MVTRRDYTLMQENRCSRFSQRETNSVQPQKSKHDGLSHEDHDGLSHLKITKILNDRAFRGHRLFVAITLVSFVAESFTGSPFSVLGSSILADSNAHLTRLPC